MKSSKLTFFAIIGAAFLFVAVLFTAGFFLRNNDPILLPVLYSTEKEAWLEAVAPGFEGQINGRPVQLQFEARGSREIYLGVLDGTEQPVLISPASALQISLLQTESAKKFGRPLVNSAACRSVARTPLVLVAWRERAEALGWLDQSGQDMWEQLHQSVVDPQGWQSYGHPEWGFVKFGHTDPDKSNSGFMTLLLLSYDYFDKSSGLTSADLLSEAYAQWFEALADYTTVGDSTGTFMEEMVAFGPSKYDMVAVYEATAVEQAENAAGRYGELHVYYPPATLLSDHPFCVLEAEWVTPEEQQAAQLFMDYLLSQPVQQKALELGFRPAGPTLPLDQANSPFTRYAANGLKIALPPEVEIPPGEVLDTLLRVWERSVRN